MGIKYYVRTTGEREFDYSPLQYETLIDTNHNSCKHFIDTLDYVQNENAVILEDDLVLCNNFQQEIEKVIFEHPDYIINFFTNPCTFTTSHFYDIFSYNQCTYFPKNLLPVIVKNMKGMYRSNIHKYYGPLLNDVLRKLGILHFVYRPALVQHKDVSSILSNCKGLNRNTIYFKDYLDALGIDLLDSVKPENKVLLQTMLEDDRMKWKEELNIK